MIAAPSRISRVNAEQVALASGLAKSMVSRAGSRETRTFKKNSQAIFILAPPRSGSSLLRVMLAGHPGIFAISELHLLGFNTLRQRKAFFSGKFSLWLEGTIRALMEIKGCDADEAIRFMDECEKQDLSTGEFYALLQQWVSPRMLAEKTPAYGLDLEVLKRAENDFENTLYVHLVRHPAAVVRSFEKHHLDQVYFTYEHPFSGRELGELFWLILHQNVLNFLSAIPASRQVRIQFEELVTRPEPIIREMCQTFGIEFHPEMVQPYKNPEKKMLDGIRPASRSMTDANFHKYKTIDAGVAVNSKVAADEGGLSDLTWKLARQLGYALPEMAGGMEGASDHETAPPTRGEFMRARKQLLRARRQGTGRKKGVGE